MKPEPGKVDAFESAASPNAGDSKIDGTCFAHVSASFFLRCLSPYTDAPSLRFR